MRALQRGPALQPAAAGAYPRADLRKAGAGIAPGNVTPEQATRLIGRKRDFRSQKKRPQLGGAGAEVERGVPDRVGNPARFCCGDAIRRYRLNSDLRAPKVHFCTFSPGTNPQLPRDVLGWTNCAQGKRNVRETNQSPEGEHHGRSLSRYRRHWPKRLSRDGAGYRLYVRPPAFE